MPSSLGPAEIVVILVVALIVLGPHRLPEAGRQVGRALAEVRRWSQSIQSEVRSVMEDEMAPPAAGPTPPDAGPTPPDGGATPAPASSTGAEPGGEAKPGGDGGDGPVPPGTT